MTNERKLERLARERQARTGETYAVSKALVTAKDRKRKTHLRNVKDEKPKS